MFWLIMRCTVCLSVVLQIFTVYNKGRKEGRKEGSVLFNDALNTFTYGYMASEHNKQQSSATRKRVKTKTLALQLNDTSCYPGRTIP